VQQKEIMFEMWDASREEGMGNEQRRGVEEMIRDYYAYDSEYAFTEAEIKRFQSRQGSKKTLFDPYGKLTKK